MGTSTTVEQLADAQRDLDRALAVQRAATTLVEAAEQTGHNGTIRGAQRELAGADIRVRVLTRRVERYEDRLPTEVS